MEAGTDPAVVGQWIDEVTATRQAIEATLHQLDAAPEPLSPVAIRAALEQVGGLAVALEGANPVLRAQLYEELGIAGTYDPRARVVAIRADLRRRMVRVGGGNTTIGLHILTESFALQHGAPVPTPFAVHRDG